MPKVTVKREFFAIRYRHAEFGARPDQSHPHLVDHALSEGKYVVVECAGMIDAYQRAHASIGTTFSDGPLKGNSLVQGDVEVIRVVEHEPVQLEIEDMLGMPASTIVTMSITGVDQVKGVPHFAQSPLSRYHPVNGWVVPETVDL